MNVQPLEVRPKGNLPWHPRYTADVVIEETTPDGDRGVDAMISALRGGR